MSAWWRGCLVGCHCLFIYRLPRVLTPDPFPTILHSKWEEFKAKQKEWNAWMDEERKVRDAERKARQEEYLRKQ